jgi:uncharacterized protein (DUF1697 family)
MPIHVALLYSVVLRPGRRVDMEGLRAMAAELGFVRPRTLVATGNLVFEAEEAAPAPIEAKLEKAFADRFGRPVDILVRPAEAWRRLAAANPFPAESAADGGRVVVRVMRRPIDPAMFAAVETRLSPGERVALVDGDLWAAFAGQPSLSRLLPALNGRKLGIGTSRNWNTVRRLDEMLAER